MFNSFVVGVLFSTQSIMQLWKTMLLTLGLLALLGSPMTRANASARQRDSIDIKDKIIELQCLARCENMLSSLQKQGCHEQCKLELLRAPRRGKCPNTHLRHYTPAQTRLSCLDNCNYDHDCAEVQKCCASACGPVCVAPLGISNDTQLPPIPKILRYKLPRNHKVELTIESSLLAYYFHVEVRSHIGRLFSQRKLSMWQWQKVDKLSERIDGANKYTDISFNMRPGRWYQVRVAAVNAYGFRGYSKPSQAFALTSNPKPPKAPNDLKIISKLYDGRYMVVKLVWCPSKSNLPVEKYKIMWSLYVNGKVGSLIAHEAHVRDTHQYEIQKLLLNSSYYIQVQAMSISGSRRLKSDKISVLYNTTLLPQEPNTPLNCTPHNSRRKYHQSVIVTENILAPTINNNAISKIYNNLTNPSTTSSYEVRFRLNRKIGMIVQILGFQPHKEKVYELCPKETNCEQREFSAIRVKKDSLEFSKLKYNTTYVLKAMLPNSVLDDSKTFTFSTPKCENFRKRFPKMQIKCIE